MHGLNRLLSRPSHLLVLRTLFHATEALSGRETERRCGLSNRATMNALEALTELSAINCEQSGNAYLYTLNDDHYLVAKALKPSLEAEEQFWDDLRKTVRKNVIPRPVAAVATGAFAREDDTSEGRIDITMLFSTGRNRIRAFRSMENLADALWDRYGISLGYELIDINSSDDEEYDALWRQVEREGVLLFGTLP